MAWNGPRHAHVTQLHPDTGSGNNDCWAASLSRYLYEAGKQSSTRDPWNLINEIDLLTHGAPDSPGNPPTTLSEAGASLAHYGLPVDWTDSYQTALAAPWSIILVDGTLFTPAQYPANWFGDPGQANHFCLFLPWWQGAANWLNDPLVPVDQDVQYAPASIAAAFYGAYLLPSTNNGETGPIHAHLVHAGALKSQPNHTSTALAHLSAGAGILDLGTRSGAPGESWTHVAFRDMWGWIPSALVKE